MKTIAYRIKVDKKGKKYLKFCLENEKTGKIIRYLTKKDIAIINEQVRKELVKNSGIIWDAMGSGKSLGEIM